MKKFWLIGVMVVALLAVGLVGCSTAGGSGATLAGIISNQQEGIWVNGTGKVTVTPDICNLYLGVNARADTVAEAQAQAAQAMSDIMTVLKANNIADKDIKTQQFSISPVYEYDKDNGTSVIIGYEVTNTVSVKIRDMENVGVVIDAAAQAGGDLTRVNGISFSVDEPEQYYEEARELAMNDAKAKAEQLANLGGVKLGKPTYIAENTYYYPQTVEYYKDIAAGASSVPPTAVLPGETDISINVQVTYSMGN